MTSDDYKLVAETLRAHFAARPAKRDEYQTEHQQEICLALGLAFENNYNESKGKLSDLRSSIFDLTQFLKECGC